MRQWTLAVCIMLLTKPFYALGEESDLEEKLGLDLFNKGGNSVRLGMYSNADGDTSSLGIQYNLKTTFDLIEPHYPNKSKPRLLVPWGKVPSITQDDLIKIGQDDYSELTQAQLEQIFKEIDHSVDDYNIFQLTLTGEGFITADGDNNLKDFNKFEVEGKYKQWRNNQITYSGGLFAAYETDQENDNAQTVYGLSLSGQYYFQKGIVNEYVFMKFDYAKVDPSDNVNRQELLDGDMSTFYRWEVDTVVQFQLSIAEIDKVEVSYRYFYEPSAPFQIKEAGMENFALFTVGIIFQKGWFIAYSDGELPFSVKDEQMFEVGWSYSFN